MSNDQQMVAFYRVLGNVFYGIAQADRHVRPEEMDEIKKIVKNEWLDAEDTFDNFGSDSAFQIEFIVDYLYENDIEIEGALFDLKEFKANNPSLFSHSVNKRIVDSASKIANSVAGTNKSELSYLVKLVELLHHED